MKLNGIKHENTNKKIIRNYKKVDKEKFRCDLLSQPWEQLGDLEIDDMVHAFNNLFLQALNLNAPLVPFYPRNNVLPRPSRKLIRLRRKRDNMRSRKNSVKLRVLRADCKRQARLENIQHAQQRLNGGQNEVWKLVKESVGQSQAEEIVDFIVKGKKLKQEEAAEAFNGFFINKIKSVRERTYFRGQPINTSEVIRAINSFGDRKSPGCDGIQPIVLKKLGPRVVHRLTNIKNSSLTLGYIPETWRRARVIFIPKAGKPSYDLPRSFRPITLLSFLIKMRDDGKSSWMAYK